MKRKIGPSTILYPAPAVLVGSLVEGKPNFMTVAWAGIACGEPPCIAVAIRPTRHTFRGIKENATFSVNVPSIELAEKVDFCGLYSGSKEDKSALFKVFYGSVENAPLIEECPINFECRVVRELELGSHVLFVGRVEETHVSEECFTGDRVDPRKVAPLIFTLSDLQYYGLGDQVGKAFNIGKRKGA